MQLTVVDSAGERSSVSEPVTVDAQPEATFACSPLLPVEGVATAFPAASSSSDRGTMISSYEWSFGDGSTATGAGASHAYAHEGSYRVTLTVTDGLGRTSSVSEVVAVIDGAPTPVISVMTVHPAPGQGVAKKLAHPFPRPGTYGVSLTVRESFGQTATTTIVVRVARRGQVSRDGRSSRRRRRKR